MIDYCPWCTAPETDCPHWIGLYCELYEEEIDFEALKDYLMKACKGVKHERNY